MAPGISQQRFFDTSRIDFSQPNCLGKRAAIQAGGKPKKFNATVRSVNDLPQICIENIFFHFFTFRQRLILRGVCRAWSTLIQTSAYAPKHVLYIGKYELELKAGEVDRLAIQSTYFRSLFSPTYHTSKEINIRLDDTLIGMDEKNQVAHMLISHASKEAEIILTSVQQAHLVAHLAAFFCLDHFFIQAKQYLLENISFRNCLACIDASPHSKEDIQQIFNFILKKAKIFTNKPKFLHKSWRQLILFLKTQKENNPTTSLNLLNAPLRFSKTILPLCHNLKSVFLSNPQIIKYLADLPYLEFAHLNGILLDDSIFTILNSSSIKVIELYGCRVLDDQLVFRLSDWHDFFNIRLPNIQVIVKDIGELFAQEVFEADDCIG